MSSHFRLIDLTNQNRLVRSTNKKKTVAIPCLEVWQLQWRRYCICTFALQLRLHRIDGTLPARTYRNILENRLTGGNDNFPITARQKIIDPQFRLQIIMSARLVDNRSLPDRSPLIPQENGHKGIG